MQNKTLRHPKALYYLFLTEMWERFGFYTVQGLLVLYMTSYFRFSDSESYIILGTFTALAYIAPIVGGYISSNLLGYKTAVLWGGVFLVTGYFLLALPFQKEFIYPALATIIIGNGLFKPNISSLLGNQYHYDDPRRDSAFTIFYIGINLGSLLAGLTSGYIKDYLGWRASFAVASVGLLIGLATFLSGFVHLQDIQIQRKTTRFKVYLFIFCLIAVVGVNYLLKLKELANWLLPILGIILLIYLTYLTMIQHIVNRKRLIILNILILSSIVFWTLFLQMFSSANLYVERLVDKTLFGIPLSTTLFWGSEAIFIILLGPFFAWSWQILGKRDSNPSPILKFILALTFIGTAFVLLGISTFFPGANNMINPLWVFSSYLLITIGELFLSPIGLSAVTWLAPPNLVGLMMGIWFVATGFGGMFSGYIAEFASLPAGELTTPEKLAIYQNAFFTYAGIAFVVAILLLLIHLSLHKKLKQI